MYTYVYYPLQQACLVALRTEWKHPCRTLGMSTFCYTWVHLPTNVHTCSNLMSHDLCTGNPAFRLRRLCISCLPWGER